MNVEELDYKKSTLLDVCINQKDLLNVSLFLKNAYNIVFRTTPTWIQYVWKISWYMLNVN
jgi:hypothetical protein